VVERGSVRRRTMRDLEVLWPVCLVCIMKLIITPLLSYMLVSLCGGSQPGLLTGHIALPIMMVMVMVTAVVLTLHSRDRLLLKSPLIVCVDRRRWEPRGIRLHPWRHPDRALGGSLRYTVRAALELLPLFSGVRPGSLVMDHHAPRVAVRWSHSRLWGVP
jgi:hypothetical protein